MEPVLQGILNRRWLVQSRPFKHMIINNIFEEAIVERLRLSFAAKLGNRFSLQTSVSNYDAIIYPFLQDDIAALMPFLDRQWLATVSNAMALDSTFEIDGAYHSHPPGSRSGWIHNDYNPGWFVRAADADEVLLNPLDSCEYKKGSVRAGLPPPIRRMRYLTLIYYLDNPTWCPGMGGETGIYSSALQDIDCPDILIAPRNNTLLVFECTPHSWHSFRCTTVRRNSMTLWLHRDFESARKQWPHHEPVDWS